jgi:hypothetical protein
VGTGLLSQYSVWQRTGRPGFDPRQSHWNLPLTSASRPALGPTQPPIQCVPGALTPGVKRGRGVMLTTHPLLVPRLRKRRSYTSCHPNAPLWSVARPLYLFFTFASGRYWQQSMAKSVRLLHGIIALVLCPHVSVKVQWLGIRFNADTDRNFAFSRSFITLLAPYKPFLHLFL